MQLLAVERQFKAALFERTVIEPAKVSMTLKHLHPEALSIFKDSYLVEFLDLAKASKDDEVVEYALSRTLSPAVVTEYQTQLPDKKLLQAKLREFYALNTSNGA